MKPGNPPVLRQEGCQFRRIVPQDEGNVQERHTPEKQGFFCACYNYPLIQFKAFRGYDHIYTCLYVVAKE